MLSATRCLLSPDTLDIMLVNRASRPSRFAWTRQCSSAEASLLPDQFDTELQLPRTGGERRDLTGEVHRRAIRVEQSVVRQRCREVRAIRDVEQLRAELKVRAPAKAADRYVLDQRSIDGDNTRANQ